jgi:hypothetical protein
MGIFGRMHSLSITEFYCFLSFYFTGERKLFSPGVFDLFDYNYIEIATPKDSFIHMNIIEGNCPQNVE